MFYDLGKEVGYQFPIIFDNLVLNYMIICYPGIQNESPITFDNSCFMIQDMRKEVGQPGIQNQSRTSSLLSESSSQPEVHPFYKVFYNQDKHCRQPFLTKFVMS